MFWKSLCFSLVSVSCVCTVRSQDWKWATKYQLSERNGKEAVYSFCGCDKSGDIYYTASIRHYTGGGGGAFETFWRLNKHSGENGQLLWEKDASGKCISDSAGNTFVASGAFVNMFNSLGQLVLTVEDQTSQFIEPALMPDGGFVVTGRMPKSFLRRYDKDGNLLWHVEDDKFAGPLYAPLVTDQAGNIYLYTYGPLNPVNSGRLIKFSPDGTRVFEKTVPHMRGHIVADPRGGVLISGRFSESDPIELNGQIEDKGGNFVIKYDFDGNLLWYDLQADGNYLLRPAAFDSDSRVYLADQWGFVGIQSLDTQGTQLYYHEFNIKVNSTSIGVDYSGNIIVVGNFKGTQYFGDYTLSTNDDNDLGDIFLAKLEANSLTTVLSLPKTSGVKELVIYPNPSGDLFTVQLPETGIPPICRIKDVTGRFISSIPAAGSRFDVNLKEQPAGVYQLEIEVGGKKEVRKLVKQ